eukprot:4331831-Amphidinium_carterae.1
MHSTHQWALSSLSRSSQACRYGCCPCRSSQPVHLGHLCLPRGRERARVVQWGREHGAHAVPGHRCQGIPLLQANRAEHPGLNDVETVLL